MAEVNIKDLRYFQRDFFEDLRKRKKLELLLKALENVNIKKLLKIIYQF